MNDHRLMKRRICKYLIPVSLLSFVVNIPKFFESKVMYTNDPSFLLGYDYDDDVAAMNPLNDTMTNGTSEVSTSELTSTALCFQIEKEHVR